MLQQVSMTRDGEQIIASHQSLTPILKQIVLDAERNVTKQYRTQRRHPEILIKKFATALFMYPGPLTYKFIQQNMPKALPCLRSVQRAIHMDYTVLSEGSFCFDELALHIKRHNAPSIVTIGEDATQITAWVDYDSQTDRCVGFVLLLDQNDLPILDAFLAVSFKAMEKMFSSTAVAKYVYVYVAQPLCQSVPPFA